MKIYLALFEGPNARNAEPLLATANDKVIQVVARALRDRLGHASQRGESETGESETSNKTEPRP